MPSSTKPLFKENIITHYFTKWRVRVWFNNEANKPVQFHANILAGVVTEVQEVHKKERQSALLISSTAEHWAELIAQGLFELDHPAIKPAAVEVTNVSLRDEYTSGVVHYYEWP